MSQQIVLLNPLELQQLINTSVRQAVREELKNISTAPEVMREKEAAKYLGLSPLTFKITVLKALDQCTAKTALLFPILKRP